MARNVHYTERSNGQLSLTINQIFTTSGTMQALGMQCNVAAAGADVTSSNKAVSRN